MAKEPISNANRQRARRARVAMADYAEDECTDFPHQYAVRDLLSDLMHFCHQHKRLSFHAELEAAKQNFYEEKTNREIETL